MTPPIRWIEREVMVQDCGGGLYLTRADRILQYQTASGEWVDVPVVGDGG